MWKGVGNTNGFNSWERAWIMAGKGPGVRAWMMKKRTFKIRGYEVTVSASEAFGHMSFAMLALSYAVSDMLELRLFAIASIGSMMVFNYWHPVGFTLWLPFRWNALFLVTNIAWVMSMMRQNQMQWIEGVVDIESIHKHIFPSLSLNEFSSLMKTAQLKHYPKGHELTREFDRSSWVYLITSGTAQVSVGDNNLFNLNEQDFVGTMGLHTSLYINKANTTTKVVSPKLQCLRWKKDQLIRSIESNPPLLAAVDAALSIDELRKLLKMQHHGPRQQQQTQQQQQTTTTTQRHSTMKYLGGAGEKPNDHSRMYDNLVKSVLGSSRVVSDEQRDSLLRFRRLYHVNDETHREALHNQGWTEKQFEDGSKDNHRQDDLHEASTSNPSSLDQDDLDISSLL